MFTHLRSSNNYTLVQGYIRENYGAHFIESISNLFYQFYNEIFHLTFDQNATKKIGVVDKEEKIFGNDKIKVRGINFEYYFQSTVLKIRPVNPQQNYSPCFQLVFEIYCDQLKIGNAQSLSWKSDNHRVYDWNKPIGDNDYDYIIPEKSKQTQMNMELLRLKESLPCFVQNTLSFRVYFDFMFMTYDDHKLSKNNYGYTLYDNTIFNDHKLSKSIEYKWQIGDELADKFMNAETGEIFYSDNFGNMKENDIFNQYGFYLKFIPKRKDGDHEFALKLLALPRDVTMINHCDVTLSNGIDARTYTAAWGDAYNSIIWSRGDENITDLLDVSREFTVNIEIGRSHRS